jgi:hypothetical protein
MNVSLNFNMFKWEGLVNIKWNNPFGYPNHALTIRDFWMVKIELYFHKSLT